MLASHFWLLSMEDYAALAPVSGLFLLTFMLSMFDMMHSYFLCFSSCFFSFLAFEHGGLSYTILSYYHLCIIILSYYTYVLFQRRLHAALALRLSAISPNQVS